MPSRPLTSAEAAVADDILARMKSAIEDAAGGDPQLLFAIRRRVYARLWYWERGKPGERRKLKAEKWVQQAGLCAMCGKPLPEKGAELDRTDAVLGYTVENTKLVHHECHRQDQAAKGFR